MSDFLVRNWGNLASVVGLVFSILAFVFAKRASTTAREARDAAMRQSLSEGMNSAARIAGEIASYLRIERDDVALLRMGDLMNQTSYLVARWEGRLSKKSKDKLYLAREELRSAHEVLTGNAGMMLTPEDRARVVWAGQRVSEIFSEEHGAALQAAEARDR